jgi:hypothetical protein
MDVAAVGKRADDLIGDQVDLARVLADHKRGELLDGLLSRGDESVDRRLGDSMDVPVGEDLDEEPVLPSDAHRISLYSRDLHWDFTGQGEAAPIGGQSHGAFATPIVFRGDERRRSPKPLFGAWFRRGVVGQSMKKDTIWGPAPLHLFWT